jgi:hypothetical protein
MAQTTTAVMEARERHLLSQVHLSHGLVVVAVALTPEL